MGFTTISFIPFYFICCTALYIASAELILLQHNDEFYCVASREKGQGKDSNLTSFNDTHSTSRWLPPTRNDLSHLNTPMSNSDHKKWEIEYHITRLKTSASSTPTCYLSPEMKQAITKKQIYGTEKSVYPHCPVGTLGKNCELRCSEIIPGNKECNGVIVCSHTGSCSCLNGLYGSTCEQECKPGYFGTGCKSQCHCKDKNSCDQVTGICHWGCAVGWIGITCNESCQYGSYGENCKNRCHSNCQVNDNQLCNFETGECIDGCKAGWEGRECDNECKNKYGPNCRSSCNCKNGATCNTTTGECKEGCPDGFVGETCNEKCDAGSYGENCKFKCIGHCRNGVSCIPETGKCPRGCDLGWGGDKCETQCTAGTYGYNCSKTCQGHCKGNDGCDLKYGNCTMGCADGYIGEKCDVNLIYIGLSLLIVVFFAIVSALCMAWMVRFKRGSHPGESNSTSSRTNRPRYSMPKFFRQSSFASSTIDRISCHRASSVPVENEPRQQETSNAELSAPIPSTSRGEATSTSQTSGMAQKPKPRARTPPRPLPRSFKFSFKKKLRQTKIPVLPGDPGSQYDDILNLDGGIVQEYQYIIENNERESTVESVQSPL